MINARTFAGWSVAGAVAFALLATGCGGKPAASGEGAPSITCAAPVHDHGRAPEGRPLIHVFRVRNSGARALRLTRVDPSYACNASGVPAVVAPGSVAELPVRCEPRGPGRIRETLVVHSDDPRAPRFELELRAEIEPLLAFESNLVELSPAFGENASRDVFVIGQRAAQATLRVAAVSEPGAQASVIAPSAGKSAGIRIVVEGKAIHSAAGHVVVATGLDRPRELTLPYAYRVEGNVRVSAERPYINLREPGPKQVVVQVASRRTDFHLRSAHVTQGPFRAEIEKHTAPGSYAVRIVFDERQPHDGARGVLGEVLLLSNDPAEPRKRLPVFALGMLGQAAPAP
ncbi:MAG TPA: DUF1573 domain-containing protein [Polyangiaceae bacterium]|nr:DUF1573 domain-containing protein [Polyangiaceae bacterium]